MKKQSSLIQIHIAVVLFGLAGLFGKWIIISPVIIVFGRVFFASLVLVIFLLFTKQSLNISPKKDYFLLFSLGLLLAVHWIVFFKSIQVSTVAIGLLSYSSFPIFTSFLEPIFFKEKLEKINILFAGLCILGVYLIIPQLDISHAIFQGVLWGLLAGFTFSILTIFNRKLSQRHSGILIAFFQDYFATLILLPFVFIIKPVLDGNSILLLVILGVFCTAISHSLFIGGMKYIKAQAASIISALEPVYGIILAFFFLNEIPSLRTILGGLIILGTTFFVTAKASR